MKKTLRNSLCILLALVMLFSCFAAGSGALYADENWQEYYSEYMKEGSAVIMNPGSDDSERNFSWYSSATAGLCKVVVSEKSDFSDPESFIAYAVITPEGDRANKATVSGLEKGKTYYYRCMTGDKIVQESSFSTLSGTSFNAMYVTDIHISRKQDGMENPLVNQSYTLNEVLNQANDKAPLDLVLSAGDQASYGDRREYMSLASCKLLNSVPYELCVGNHDRKGIAYKFFNNNPNKNIFGISSLIGNDYWFVKGDVLFLIYDSNCTAALTHRAFTKAAVEANPDVKWKVALMHHDLFGRLTDSRLEDADENRRPTFVPIFDEFGIDLALLGHSHFYSISNVLFNGEIVERTGETHSVTDAKGTVYMVSCSINRPRDTGNASEYDPCKEAAITTQQDGPVYNVINFTSDSITISSYNLDEEQPFNTFTLNKTSSNGGHPEYKLSAETFFRDLWLEFLAFWTEFGEGVAGIWKNYFDN